MREASLNLFLGLVSENPSHCYALERPKPNKHGYHHLQYLDCLPPEIRYPAPLSMARQ